jgi:riboflavin synthase
MFTGIVQEIGRAKENGGSSLIIEAAASLDGLKLGDSIAVNGTCLTVASLDEGSFSVDTMPETLRRTNLGLLTPGAPVNLEQALTLSTPLGGHITQGHVDATGSLVSTDPEGDALMMRFEAPPQVMKYIVEKGFIAVDGASLTVVDCDESAFSVSIIPYTRENTILGSNKVGDLVNLEVDILAKYVERLAPGKSTGD